jgi:hypothetical protein
MGSLRSEATEKIHFVDKKNDIKAEIAFGKVKKRYFRLRYRPTDYFESAIHKNGKEVSKFDGTYCGYINFDNVRYWDGRYLQAFKV